MASVRTLLRSIASTSRHGNVGVSTPLYNHHRSSIPRTALNMLSVTSQSTITAAPSSWTMMRSAFSTNSVPQAKKNRPGPGEGFEVNFVLHDGEEVSVRAFENESLLDVAWANDIDIEGACEASLACSTCHLILDEDSFAKLEEPTDEENDMLDLAFGLTDTSRLGCQVLMNKNLDGIVAKIPTMTRNAQA
ncbi:hypothetical protein BGZ94_005416 [Podila epigama]|nr:hypothetical protein BGZ94_005416 [Podila epigama]